jgi:hypothetical protein
MWLEGRLSCSIEVQLVSKLSRKLIRSQQIFSICPSPMIQEEKHNMCVRNVTIPVLIQHFSMWLEDRLTCSIEVQLLSKLSGKFIRSQQIFSIYPSPMIQEETHNMCVRNVTILMLIKYIFPMWLEGWLTCSIEVQLVNKLSGKFIRSQNIFSIYPSPMLQYETHNMCVRNVTIPALIQHFSNVSGG